MRVIIKRVGNNPEIWDIKNELSVLQSIVGGYIECVTNWDLGYVVVCDEEGMIKGYEPNCLLDGVDYCGTIIIAGTTADDFTDLSDENIRLLRDKLMEM